MALSKFVANRRAIKRIPHTPPVERAANRAAQTVAAEARRRAPVLTGRYKRGIKASAERTADGWVGRVDATDFKSYWVELGTNGIRKHRVLGGSLDVLGRGRRR